MTDPPFSTVATTDPPIVDDSSDLYKALKISSALSGQQGCSGAVYIRRVPHKGNEHRMGATGHTNVSRGVYSKSYSKSERE
ncbi:hypothetical protein QJS04_geneDACA022057 [Acorus gramineus]|uniref:Uncharacterized protein n=1 Tax=Acorus gramineus TaxID=55184 RepID=A0AAV9B476_ACOGR|nr:hypothetical protein QJS04_geneDACA022057 [Acorus gramineus]